MPAYLSDLIGKPATALLPSGDAGRQWRQLLNEAQMALHAHPVNAARSAQGKFIINSLALWGEGRAPSPQAIQHATLWSNDQIIAGAGKLAGISISSLPPRFSSIESDCIVNWDSLRFATASRDAMAWRDGLQQLEQDWLMPALHALNNGSLKRIELHGFGDGENISATMSATDRYRFWRQPRRLESL